MDQLVGFDSFVVLAVAVTLIAAASDLKTGHIPNWLTLGALLLGAASRLLQGAWFGGIEGLRGEALQVGLGIVVCALVPLLLWRIAHLGGGDFKLLTALGAICGPTLGLRAQIYSFIVMFAYLVARLTYEGQLGTVLWRSVGTLLRPLFRRPMPVPKVLLAPVRFGPAISIGTGLALLVTRSFG